MTMSLMISADFSDYYFALEPFHPVILDKPQEFDASLKYPNVFGIQEDHQYRSHFFISNLDSEEYVPEIVTLRQPDATSVPMPDPDLLRLHYQVARILDASGIRRKMLRAGG